MEKLKKEQCTLIRHIENFITNTNKTGKENHTVGFIQARLTLLEKYWIKFCDYHAQIQSQATAGGHADESSTDDSYSRVEISYCESVGILTELLQKLQQSSGTTTAPQHEASPPNHLTSLPKLELPRFGGDLREWPAFHDLFLSLIHSNKGLTGSQKLYYLKTSLYGSAEQILRNIAITDANFDSAWNILCNRYQNERLLVTSYLKNLTSLPALKTESSDELRRLFDGTLETVQALECLQRPVKQWDDWLVFITVQKLDTVTRKDWENSLVDDTKLPSFDLLCQFLQHRINTLEAVKDSSAKYSDSLKIRYTKS